MPKMSSARLEMVCQGDEVAVDTYQPYVNVLI
jgi:hypothetical protein